MNRSITTKITIAMENAIRVKDAKDSLSAIEFSDGSVAFYNFATIEDANKFAAKRGGELVFMENEYENEWTIHELSEKIGKDGMFDMKDIEELSDYELDVFDCTPEEFQSSMFERAHNSGSTGSVEELLEWASFVKEVSDAIGEVCERDNEEVVIVDFIEREYDIVRKDATFYTSEYYSFAVAVVKKF